MTLCLFLFLMAKLTWRLGKFIFFLGKDITLELAPKSSSALLKPAKESALNFLKHFRLSLLTFCIAYCFFVVYFLYNATMLMAGPIRYRYNSSPITETKL